MHTVNLKHFILTSQILLLLNNITYKSEYIIYINYIHTYICGTEIRVPRFKPRLLEVSY